MKTYFSQPSRVRSGVVTALLGVLLAFNTSQVQADDDSVENIIVGSMVGLAVGLALNNNVEHHTVEHRTIIRQPVYTSGFRERHESYSYGPHHFDRNHRHYNNHYNNRHYGQPGVLQQHRELRRMRLKEERRHRRERYRYKDRYDDHYRGHNRYEGGQRIIIR